VPDHLHFRFVYEQIVAMFSSKFVLLLLLGLVCVTASAEHHRFLQDDRIPLWVNRVGPFNNPQEFYAYYDLPFCAPEVVERPFTSLGEALQGYMLQGSPILIKFRENLQSTVWCRTTLDVDAVAKFRHAVQNQYWFQFFFDDLPVWGMVGEEIEIEKTSRQYIYTHYHFDISYNADRVIDLNLTSEHAIELKEGMEVDFTYSVKWTQSPVQFENRWEKYLDKGFFEHQIHWFSLFNSGMLVIFLAGLMLMVLMRTLRRDYGKYGQSDDEDDDLADEYGWKQIHGDAFRTPRNLILFSACVGTGYQMAVMVTWVLSFALMRDYYQSRGRIVNAIIAGYLLSSVVAGYASGSLYLRNSGKKWMKTLLATWALFPAISTAIIGILQVLTMSYGVQATVPFSSIFMLVALWVLLALPLTILGTIVGRHWSGSSSFPCRVNQVPRQIPEKPFLMRRWVTVLVAGILPFSSVFIEVYFIFTSVWHYKYYYVYGFMFVVYIILLDVIACSVVISTYFTLNTEDYRWQWTSFWSGASTGLYVFLYSVYYYFTRTYMTGLLQAALYFGYMAIFSVTVAFLAGGVGYFAASAFVYKIYRNVKVD